MSSPPTQDLSVQPSNLDQADREAFADLAQTTPLKTCVRITNTQALQRFVAVTTRNPAIGKAVEDLAILLTNASLPAQAIRDCLRLTPNIISLDLKVPPEGPAIIFQSALFPRLTILTTNRPHDDLVAFLSLHPLVTSLALQACGAPNRCPLGVVNLSRVSTLQCPARCFEGIARGQVTTATVNLTRTTSMAALAIQALSSSTLQSLSVEFFSDDHDILSRIAAAGPRLQKLKLIEKPRAQRRFIHARRPWNNLREWHRTLMQLPHLEELMLQTVTRIGHCGQSANDIVTKWANGVGRQATRHPNLYHISILQQNGIGGMQHLSHWFKKEESWECTVTTTVSRSHSFVV